MQLQDEINNGLNMYIASEGNNNVGCVGTKCSKDENIWYIEKLAVIPTKRHTGIGSELLIFAINEIASKHAQKISIGIINENKQLKSWYEHHGFYEYEVKHVNHLPFTVCLMYKDL